MCGIAGFCLSPNERLNPRKLAKCLLAGIEPRGKDATGAAWRVPTSGQIQLDKAPIPASEFISTSRSMPMPRSTNVAILHTRLATQGPKENNFNNHPIRAGHVVGVHNGCLWNDDGLFEKMQVQERRRGQVDSEAIFAALAWGTEPLNNDTNVTRIPDASGPCDILGHTRGSAAVAWLDTRNPRNVLELARISSSPLVVAQTKSGSFLFASLELAIKNACDTLGLEIEYMAHLKEAEYLKVEGGVISEYRDFPTRVGTYSYYTRNYRPSYSYSYEDYDDKRTPTRGYSYGSGPTSMQGVLLPTVWRSTTTNETFAQVLASELTDVNPMRKQGIATYLSQYTQRETAIDMWVYATQAEAGDELTLSQVKNMSKQLGSALTEGVWVATKVAGKVRAGQIYELPDTFPEGDYVLRVKIPSERKHGTEWIFCTREYWEFETISDDLIKRLTEEENAGGTDTSTAGDSGSATTSSAA